MTAITNASTMIGTPGPGSRLHELASPFSLTSDEQKGLIKALQVADLLSADREVLLGDDSLKMWPQAAVIKLLENSLDDVDSESLPVIAEHVVNLHARVMNIHSQELHMNDGTVVPERLLPERTFNVLGSEKVTEVLQAYQTVLGVITESLPDDYDMRGLYGGLDGWLKENWGIVMKIVNPTADKTADKVQGRKSKESKKEGNFNWYAWGAIIAVTVVLIIASMGSKADSKSSATTSPQEMPPAGLQYTPTPDEQPQYAPPTPTSSPPPTPTKQPPTPVPTLDVSKLSDEEKLLLAPDFDGYKKYVSQTNPNYIILSSQSGYKIFNLEMNEVIDLNRSGLHLLTKKTGDFVEFKSYSVDVVLDRMEESEASLLNGKYSSLSDPSVQMKEEADLYNLLYSLKELDVVNYYRGGFPVMNRLTGEPFGVFVLGVKNGDGSVGTLLVFRDINGKPYCYYVPGDPKSIRGELWYMGSLP